MSHTKAILQAIADQPGITSVEIADKVDVEPKNVQPLIHPYINDGRIKVEKKPVAGGAPVNAYFPSQSLMKELDGVQQIVTGRGRPKGPAVADAAPKTFSCGFFTDGRISIVKDRKTIDLSPEETAQLLAFIDSNNIERIVGVQA
ncbi:hypothetical protein [Burkholderia vietnamiensis]|uniref:hypothetical protein n=1 Tax=Burkholderia vietnamiensis TaxID=60552 RepID=UPI0015882B00|nr:hypothetical protein [Burkholderia vietnamiensis]